MNNKNTFDLIKPIVEAINKTFVASNIIDLTGGIYKLESCNTLWLTNGYVVAIGGVDFTIQDILPNNWIKVKGPSMPNTNTFDIYPPIFTHGTILAQSQELDQKKTFQQKFPMIYLHEITHEKFYQNPESSIERESDCDLYFLAECNIKDWLTIDHDKYAIAPMRNLLKAFVDTAYASSFVGEFDDYDVYDHANFGYYQTDKGHVKQVFNDHTSGCQLKITLPLLKTLLCGSCD